MVVLIPVFLRLSARLRFVEGRRWLQLDNAGLLRFGPWVLCVRTDVWTLAQSSGLFCLAELQGTASRLRLSLRMRQALIRQAIFPAAAEHEGSLRLDAPLELTVQFLGTAAVAALG